MTLQSVDKPTQHVSHSDWYVNTKRDGSFPWGHSFYLYYAGDEMYILEAEGGENRPLYFNEGQGRRAQKDGDKILFKEFEDTDQYLAESLIYFSSVE